jgi:hypothetical protein
MSLREIPMGSPGVLSEISYERFPPSGIIRANNSELPFRVSSPKYIEVFLPERLLRLQGTLSLELRVGKDASPIVLQIPVVQRRFQASLALDGEKSRVTPDEDFVLTIAIKNDGQTAFYVPSAIEPFTVGPLLSAFEFEIFADSTPVPFSGILVEAVGGVVRRADIDFLAAGEIIKLGPHYAYSRTIRTNMKTLTTMMRLLGTPLRAGTYRLRALYRGIRPPLKQSSQTPFLDELLYSNEIAIQVR